MKRILATCLSTILACSLWGNIAVAKEYKFQDAAQLPWAATSIERLYKEGIIKGMSDTQFAPNAPLTRGQFAAMLAQLSKKPNLHNEFPFEDVPKNQWFYEPVKKMYSQGLVKGTSANQYSPDRNVTREEAIVILAQTFDSTFEGQYKLSFRDQSSISSWAQNSVKGLVARGHLDLFKDRLEPKKAITRAEVAVILHQILYGAPEPYVKPKLTSRSSELLDQRLNRTVQSVLGVPYKFGGTTPKGFDCSGFTSYVYGQLGVDLPRDSRSQFGVGTSVSMSEMEKGDLIFFDTGSGVISHVSIYLGNDKIAHATSTGKNTRIDDIDWYVKNYRVVGVKRVM
ncbi:S-layer homology domain-containing protein [Ammoniphilus sp. YIM 78166]|uniref:S-layer homology domain-containing protein n=1 Tax=Ammoniphilus sp. YIM 78166 TaxID=1644106 RepID=UPI00106FE624|nr:S-layer homology domain-containing protein [Ammoniphilus sp. YIM 78166]